jgi:hypothetical protein
MGKVRSTITGGGSGATGDYHGKAYSRIHHRDSSCMTTANGTHVGVPSNSLALNNFVESDSVRSKVVYDWQSGTYRQEKLDIVENGHAQINRLRIQPVTNGRHVESEKMQGNRGWAVEMATPTVTKAKKPKRGK